ncbi:hypothetical protein AB1Y20_021518 [Prymnesium parvum]|uniref:Uncharacterized protein n=1 Tax=Prymnesium parvum TaxID=97485 RepID=A0AB34JLU1_PRYPA
MRPVLPLLLALAVASEVRREAAEHDRPMGLDQDRLPLRQALEETPHASHPHELEAFMPLWVSVLLFAAAGAALSLCGHYHLSLSDMCDDRINPITLCRERISTKLLRCECALHAAEVGCWVFVWPPFGLFLALFTLAVRLSWASQLTLDPTTIFVERVQRNLRTKWCVMAGWHAIAAFLGFFQLTIHGVNAIQRHARQFESTAGNFGHHPLLNPHFTMHMHHAI